MRKQLQKAFRRGPTIIVDLSPGRLVGRFWFPLEKSDWVGNGLSKSRDQRK